MSAPLVPSYVDLRDYPACPVRVKSVSEYPLWPLKDDVFKVAFMLMLHAWHGTPASSLPDDNRVLAKLAQVTARKWRRIKAHALCEFVLCSDGRWYHSYLAERANAVWEKKLAVDRRWARHVEMESGEWANIRFGIFKRDGFTCQYCGAKGVRLECDHVLPVSKGGRSEGSNLVTACKPCNRSKGAKLLSEWRH